PRRPRLSLPTRPNPKPPPSPADPTHSNATRGPPGPLLGNPMNRPTLTPGATLAISMLGALLGLSPCDDPECQACNGKDEPLTSEAAKAQAEKAAINTGARAFVEDHVMNALHEVLRQA